MAVRAGRYGAGQGPEVDGRLAPIAQDLTNAFGRLLPAHSVLSDMGRCISPPYWLTGTVLDQSQPHAQP